MCGFFLGSCECVKPNKVQKDFLPQMRYKEAGLFRLTYKQRAWVLFCSGCLQSFNEMVSHL